MAPAHSTTKRSIDHTPAKVSTKARRVQPPAVAVRVGDWITMVPISRREVDLKKAISPCVVTSVTGDLLHVLYPNMLSVFFYKTQGDASVLEFKTETCERDQARVCSREKFADLDRSMTLVLCQALARKRQSGPESAIGVADLADGGGKEVQSPPSKKDVRMEGGDISRELLNDISACVAKAFQSAGRDVLSKSHLETLVTETFSIAEARACLLHLEGQNKVMLAEDAVFLIA